MLLNEWPANYPTRDKDFRTHETAWYAKNGYGGTPSNNGTCPTVPSKTRFIATWLDSYPDTVADATEQLAKNTDTKGQGISNLTSLGGKKGGAGAWRFEVPKDVGVPKSTVPNLIRIEPDLQVAFLPNDGFHPIDDPSAPTTSTQSSGATPTPDSTVPGAAPEPTIIVVDSANPVANYVTPTSYTYLGPTADYDGYQGQTTDRPDGNSGHGPFVADLARANAGGPDQPARVVLIPVTTAEGKVAGEGPALFSGNQSSSTRSPD